MKKLFIVALLVVGMTSFAQEKQGRMERTSMEKMTPEQRNQLHLKKMTLALDLNASQQKEMSKIIAEQSTTREARIAERKATKEATKKQLTSEERFAKRNQMLDDQIVMKERMKKILSQDQFKKWDEMKGKKHYRMNQRRAQHNGRKAANRVDKK